MEIEFEFVSKKKINIIGVDGNTKKIVGHIFTPGGSIENNKNAIQICGLSYAYDYWGCSMFRNKVTKEAMRDIQLLFEMESEYCAGIDNFDPLKDCAGCFNKVCTCDNKDKLNPDEIKNKREICPFNVKRESDIIIEKI